MRGVLADALGSGGGDVGHLVADVDAGTGDAPITVTAGPALLVEVEVVLVAGVAVLSGPDLQAGARVAREDGNGLALVVGAFDVEGMVETAVVGGMEAGVAMAFGAAQKLVGRVDARGLLHEVGVDEEELEGGFAEGLL